MKTLLLFLLILKTLDSVLSFCVLDSKKGWWLDCGVRDSYLFRIKDLGGIQANFDLGFGFGDEKGFPNSILKTNQKSRGHYPPPTSGHDPYLHEYRRTNKYRGQNRRSDFPYRYENPPAKNLIPPSTRQISRENRFSQPVHRFASSTSPSIPVNSQPKFQNAPYQYPRYQSSQSSTSYRAPIQPVKRTHWIPVSKETRASPWQSSPSFSNPPFQQNQESQTLSSQNVRQDAQRKEWREAYSEPQARRRMPWSRTPEQPWGQGPHNKFSSSSQEFGQRSHDVNNWWPPYNPSSQLIPPPPPPPHPPNFHRQDIGFGSSSGFGRPFVFHISSTTTPPPPTVGPAMSELLNVPAHLSANSDNVPSFAAKMFIVREAPPEFYPPNYDGDASPRRRNLHVEIPRTKFYCEDQKYLPGIYADSLLGCKMFHLCVPSSIGSTLTSYLCPNGTLFDQSILQCNYWYNVDCESSVKDYDANLALALSYRRINAAHLPLQAATNAIKLSLLSQNINQLQVSNPKKQNQLSRRMGRVLEIENPLTISKNVSGHYLGISLSGDNESLRLKSENNFSNSLKNETESNTTFSMVEKTLALNSLNTFSKNSLVLNFSDSLRNKSLEKPVSNIDHNNFMTDLIRRVQTQFRSKTKSYQEINS